MELINALSSPETQMNGNFQTLEWAQVYGRRAQVTTGLTWGYYGGMWGGITAVDGTLTLTDAAANYIVVEKSTGAISVSTAATNWNDTATYARVYKVTTAASVVSAVEDHRAGEFGIILGVPGSPGPAGPPGAPGTVAMAVSDTLPAGLAQGEQWYESDTAGFYMRYVNPDATETLISLSTTGGDFVPMAAKGQANGVPSLDAGGTIPQAQLPGGLIRFIGQSVVNAGLAQLTWVPLIGDPKLIAISIDIEQVVPSSTVAMTFGFYRADGVSVFAAGSYGYVSMANTTSATAPAGAGAGTADSLPLGSVNSATNVGVSGKVWFTMPTGPAIVRGTYDLYVFGTVLSQLRGAFHVAGAPERPGGFFLFAPVNIAIGRFTVWGHYTV